MAFLNQTEWQFGRWFCLGSRSLLEKSFQETPSLIVFVLLQSSIGGAAQQFHSSNGKIKLLRKQ